MDLTSLRYFQTVAQELSFTKAAIKLRVQQPAVSKAIRVLEEELGYKILERNKRSVSVTRDGIEVLKICVRIFDEITEIKKLNEKNNIAELAGALSFGASDAISTHLIPRWLNAFLKSHPLVKPSLFSGTSSAICDEILNGKLEFGLFFTEPNTAVFDVTQIGKSSFLMVAKLGYTERERPKGNFIASREEDYSVRKSYPVQNLLKQAHLKFEVSIAANNLEAQKQMVLQGLGFAVFPGFFVESEVQKGRLEVLLPAKKFVSPIYMVKRKGKTVSTIAQGFIREITSHSL